MKTVHLVLAFLFLSIGSAFSQMVNLEEVVKVKFSFQQKEGEGEVIASIEIKPGWHINSHKLPKDSQASATDIKINPVQGISSGKLTEPKPIQFIDEVLGDMQSHHTGKLIMKRAVKISSDKNVKLKGVFSFQVCDEAGYCVQPHDYPFELMVKAFVPTTNSDNTTQPVDTSAQEKTSTDPKTPKADQNQNQNQNQSTEKGGKSLWVIFILSFLSGFAALLTPCVFPMIPMTVSFFTKQSQSKAAGIRNAVLYGLSIIAIYVLLGTFITAIFGPSALNELSTNVWFNILFFLLLVIFSISFLGAFEITLPNSWLNNANNASYK